ncbi:hypothetical protein D3C73_1373880 [compost metagenome]
MLQQHQPRQMPLRNIAQAFPADQCQIVRLHQIARQRNRLRIHHGSQTGYRTSRHSGKCLTVVQLPVQLIARHPVRQEGNLTRKAGAPPVNMPVNHQARARKAALDKGRHGD